MAVYKMDENVKFSVIIFIIMVKDVKKLTLTVKIDKFEFDNIQTGYTPLPGSHDSFHFNDTGNWINLQTPSPLDCKDIEFLLMYGE